MSDKPKVTNLTAGEEADEETSQKVRELASDLKAARDDCERTGGHEYGKPDRLNVAECPRCGDRIKDSEARSYMEAKRRENVSH